MHNYLGNIDLLTVAAVIEKHLHPLEDCIRVMLAQNPGGGRESLPDDVRLLLPKTKLHPNQEASLESRYHVFLIAELRRKGVDVLFPLHRARCYDFRRGQRLGKVDPLVSWKKPRRPAWMDQSTYAGFADHLTVRVGAVQLDSRGFRMKSRVLIIPFLEPHQTRLHELTALYDHRWRVEWDLHSIK